MKNILYLTLIISFASFLSSCSKSSGSDSGYYLKASFDGTAKSFNSVPVIAVKSWDGTGNYNLYITGFSNLPTSGIPTSNTEEASLTLWSDKDDFIAGKTFTSVEVNGVPVNNFVYVSVGTNPIPGNSWTSTYDFSSVKESFSCTITEVTSTYIKGSFSTTIYQGVESPIVSKNVTNGEFYAKITAP